ncbi:hypothetical protein BY996DRAFT_4373394 [Phakopsora pachyrhizi]|uniref:Expressed protein n=1 Tax=Phakopsora pachyrhizi TaxID=170000 RepID=A0AAV0BTA6_PHAPC|nr:hypothetical protein BY996DRAFT_4373394 [Phakopsora pachyrhizi]CAH7671716.1 expressed protein [Phakopsora pachyrhizi]CAH7689451.1 expressed protein [Phakopsora pachyrhizi]
MLYHSADEQVTSILQRVQVKSASLSQLPSEEKYKHEIFKFMLCDLIQTGPLSQPNTTESQKNSAISTWAIVVLVALCHEPNAGKEPLETVTSIRSFALGSWAQTIQVPLF